MVTPKARAEHELLISKPATDSYGYLDLNNICNIIVTFVGSQVKSLFESLLTQHRESQQS